LYLLEHQKLIEEQQKQLKEQQKLINKLLKKQK
jgi:hypothetical protein